MPIGSLIQQRLLERIGTVEDAAGQPLLIDGPLNDQLHNRRARVLRNGLMVVAFTALEDFLRERVGEMLSSVSRTTAPFVELPEKLQNAAVLEALKAAHDRARLAIRAGEDGYALAQDAAAAVASTNGQSILSITKYSLAHSSPNVSHDDISNALGALQVQGPWQEINAVVAKCGFGFQDLRLEYENAQKMRNAAAHAANANVPTTDLSEFCKKAIAVAMGFDLVGSCTVRLLGLGDRGIRTAKVRPSALLKLAFLDESDRGFVHKGLNNKRAFRVSTDYPDIAAEALARATRHNESLIERDRRKTPRGWQPEC